MLAVSAVSAERPASAALGVSSWLAVSSALGISFERAVSSALALAVAAEVEAATEVVEVALGVVVAVLTAELAAAAGVSSVLLSFS